MFPYVTMQGSLRWDALWGWKKDVFKNYQNIRMNHYYLPLNNPAHHMRPKLIVLCWVCVIRGPWLFKTITLSKIHIQLQHCQLSVSIIHIPVVWKKYFELHKFRHRISWMTFVHTHTSQLSQILRNHTFPLHINMKLKIKYKSDRP